MQLTALKIHQFAGRGMSTQITRHGNGLIQAADPGNTGDNGGKKPGSPVYPERKTMIFAVHIELIRSRPLIVGDDKFHPVSRAISWTAPAAAQHTFAANSGFNVARVSVGRW